MKIGETKSEEEDASQGFVDSVYLVSKVVEGKYPNYKQVIPAESNERVTMDKEELQHALRRAEIMTSGKARMKSVRREATS